MKKKVVLFMILLLVIPLIHAETLGQTPSATTEKPRPDIYLTSTLLTPSDIGIQSASEDVKTSSLSLLEQRIKPFRELTIKSWGKGKVSLVARPVNLDFDNPDIEKAISNPLILSTLSLDYSSRYGPVRFYLLPASSFLLAGQTELTGFQFRF